MKGTRFWEVFGVLVFGAGTAYFGYFAFARGGWAVLINLPLAAISCFFFAGIVANRVLQGPLDNFFYGLLGSREKIAKAPPLISQVEMLLRQDEPDSALVLAQEFYGKNPGSAALALIIGRILIEYFGQADEGIKVIEEFFTRHRPEQSEENLGLLFLMTDACESIRASQRAVDLLEYVLRQHRKILSPGDQRMIRQRLDSLRLSV